MSEEKPPSDEQRNAQPVDNAVEDSVPRRPDPTPEEMEAARRRTREQWAREDAAKRAKRAIGPSAPLPRVNLPDPIEEEQKRIRAEEQRREIEREIREAEKEARIKADRDWPHSAPPRFASAHVDSLEGVAKTAVDMWLAYSPRPNLILTGPTGVGKTHVAFAISRWYEVRGKTTLFKSLPQLMDDLRPGSRSDEVFEKAKNVNLLVIDDIGAERATDWTNERLYLILDHRWMWELPTVVTTNLNSDTLRKALGSRAFSRLCPLDALFIDVDGEDRRGPKI